MYPTTSLQPGATGSEVKKLQDFLVSQGFLTQAQVNTGYGNYGPATTAAVKAWQQAKGVDNSSGPGYWGPKSIAIASGSSSSSNTGSTSYSSTPSTSTSNHVGIDVPTSTYGYNTNTTAVTKGQTGEQLAEVGARSFVDPSFITSLINNNPDILAAYINAIAYGGYQVGDVINDIKRREMISKGDTSVSSLAIISPTIERQTYYTSDPVGIKAQSDAVKIIPSGAMQGILNPDILNYGLNMPSELFEIKDPLLDRTSQEFKNAVANTKSAYYDLANAQLQASTEQEKAVADYNYKQWKDDTEKKYGIALSDDATKVYSQIQNLESTFNTRGLGDSGMKNEAIDSSLKTSRTADQRLRDEKLTAEEAQRASVIKASGTPQQIQDLINEDKAKGLPQSEWRATKWGLIPSADILAKYDINSLKAQFPDSTTQELQNYRNAVIDENGNYRSTTYANYYDKLNTNKISEKSAAETKVFAQATDRADKAAEASSPTGVLAQTGGTGSTPSSSGLVKSNTPDNTSNVTPPSNNQAAIDAAMEQAKKIQTAINNYTPPTQTYTAPKAPAVVAPTSTYTVPKTPTPLVSTPTASSSYKIVSGDTLGAIAARNNTTVANLAKLNSISDPNKIYAGQSIKLK